MHVFAAEAERYAIERGGWGTDPASRKRKRLVLNSRLRSDEESRRAPAPFVHQQ
jgi:hypothetical protein